MTHVTDTDATALSRFSLDRRITVLVLVMSVAVVGWISTKSIPLELMPRGFETQSIQIHAPWQDSPSKEVLEKLTLPLEEELSTVKGLDGMTSYSRRGQSSVYMRFKHGTDMNVAYREVRDRVERARLRFPDDQERVFIRKEDVSGIPVAFVGMSIDPSLTDYYNLIQKEIVLPFERVDGVASVTVNGLLEKEIIIEVDREKAEGAGLNIYQLSQELGGDNFTMASGNVRDNGKKFLLRSVATYKDLEALENRLITNSIRLKDIAKVKYEEPDKRFSVRVDSKPAVALIIQKEGEANTVAISRELNRTLKELQANPRLADIDMDMLFSQGDVVEESIQNLVNGGRIGGLFAIVVLFFFLRRLRLTLIITLSIPVSLLMALTTMYFLGETLNLLTMLGLMICVGLLVDNAVVVAENIHRLHRNGVPRREACIKGASEMGLAITMATLTTVAVFLPVSLIDGQFQFFLMRLSLPISVSLLASLLVALVAVPLCVYLTLPSSISQKETLFRKGHNALNAVLRHAYEATFERLNRIYGKLLGFFLVRRLDLVLMITAIFVISQMAASDRVKFVDQQEEDRTSFNLDVDLSKEHNFEDAKAYFREAEKVLEKNKDEYGLDGYIIFHQTGGGSIQGWLSKETTRTQNAKDISEKVMADLPERAGVKIYMGNENEADEEDGNETYTIYFQGEDAEQLDEVATELEPLFTNLDGVLGLKKGEDESPNELALVIDGERASASNVNPQAIAGVVNYAIRGSALPRFNDNGREIPVRIRFEEEDRETLSELSNFAVPTNDGNALPLSALTDIKVLSSPKRIVRRDKKITRSLTLELNDDGVNETRERIQSLISNIDLPEGVVFGTTARMNKMDDEVSTMILTLVLSIFFIYLLMGFLFESFFLPLSIIFTIPLAMIGVWWIHIITGKNMDFLGGVGIVLLVGVVVNNGIVLIDYVNRLRDNGVERGQALLLAAERRFRPILMTALTTIIGMIPLAVSKPSSLGISYKSFGLTLIGGMSTATVLTLLVIPVLYTLFDDMFLWLRSGYNFVNRKRRTGSSRLSPAFSEKTASAPEPN